MYEQWVYNISILFEGVAKYENKKKKNELPLLKFLKCRLLRIGDS